MKKNISIYLIALFFVSHSICFADVINSISGAVDEGESINIYGSFTEKTVAAPLIWEDFESGTNESTLQSIDSTWLEYATYGGSDFTNTKSYGGSMCARNYVDDADSGTQFSTNYKKFAVQDEIYATFKCRWEMITGSDATGIWKLPRIATNESSSYYGEPNIKLQQGNDQLSLYGDYNNGTTTTAHYFSDYKILEDTWGSVEYYGKLGDAGISNGDCYMKVSNNVGFNDVDVNTRDTGETFQYEAFWLGTAFANPGSGVDYYLYVDSVYVDNTRQKITLGNASTYSSCTILDPQPATSWTTSSIIITFNQGQYAEGDIAYLYVILDDGTVSDGYEITIGSTTTSTNFQASNVTFNGNITIS